MIEILGYITIAILLLIILFFLLRSLVVAITMLTEVPFLPSNKLYKQAIEYLDIQVGDKVVDLGCGDGRVLIYASKKYPNSQFVGIDRNPLLIIYAKFIKLILNRRNLQFQCINIHDFDISKFDKIYIYLLPKIVDQIIEEKKHELKKGCTVLSFHYGFSKNFYDINNVTKYPVKYRNKEENIFKWVNK
jgi:tRNA G46 methylase TrmB